MSGRIWAAAIAVLMSVALSGCAATGADYSDLSLDATPDDAWPSSLPAYASEHIDVASSRLVGRDGATSLYLVRSTESQHDVCLLVYPNDNDWMVGCGQDGLSVDRGGSSTYVVRSDGSPRDGNAISDNVYLEKR
jgi:hypothetical protein